MNSDTTDEKIKEAVRQVYGSLARRFDDEPAGSASGISSQACCCAPGQPASCCGPSQPVSCCGPSEPAAELSDAAARFYSADELTDLPGSVTGASAGCGNPIAISELQPGETVLDLGSGGGIDCFLAARQVGPEGRVIGLDMTPDMIKLARRNARKLGTQNVDFRFGEMEDMPLPDESVDVIISNCVINLSPDKDAVFGEAYRVLRPGGRMNVSDIVTNGELPQAIRARLDAWAGCIAGALEESDYLGRIRAAGFVKVEVLSRDYLPVGEVLREERDQVPEDRRDAPPGSLGVQGSGADSGFKPDDLAGTVASIRIRAFKPV